MNNGKVILFVSAEEVTRRKEILRNVAHMKCNDMDTEKSTIETIYDNIALRIEGNEIPFVL